MIAFWVNFGYNVRIIDAQKTLELIRIYYKNVCAAI